MHKYLFVLLVFIFLNGCKKQNEIQTQSPLKPNVTSDTSRQDTLKNANQPEIHEGIYITNLNTKSFRDCQKPDSLYWVIDESNKLESQYKKMFEVQSVYNSLYAKVKAEVEETKDPVTRDKYPRTLRVKEVITIEKKNYKNTCVAYDFWAFGNEPSWSLQISKNEKLIEFIYPEEKKTYSFFYAEPKEEDGYLIYTNHNKIQGYIIDVKILKEKCSDTKSDMVYEYSASVELTGDKKFKGCAIKGARNN